MGMNPAVNPTEGLSYVRAAALASAPPEEQWLVRSLWPRSAVGILGGHPKLGLCRYRHKQLHAASRIMPRRCGQMLC